MTIFLIIVHTLIAILLATTILMQSGRGGGLTEMAGGAESMLGANTSAFMVRATAVLATIFLVTSLTLAVISSKKGKSMMPQKVAAPVVPTDFMSDVEDLDLPGTEDVSQDIITNPLTSEDLPDVQTGI